MQTNDTSTDAVFVDWLALSLSIPVDGQHGERVSAETAIRRAQRSAGRHLPRVAAMMQEVAAVGGEAQWVTADRPYNVAHALPYGGKVSVDTRSVFDTALCTWTGQGASSNNSLMLELLAEAAQSAGAQVARVDIAADFSGMTVDDVIGKHPGIGRGTRSQSHIVSDTGETRYYGSPKSDRFATVYAYSESEAAKRGRPGARIEIRLRKKYARAFADAVVLAGGASLSWGFKVAAASVLESMGVTLGNLPDERVRVTIPDKRRIGKTVTWLEKQVRPAVVRLMRDAQLTPGQMCEILGIRFGEGE